MPRIMPRKKGWQKAECKVTDWERRKTGKYDIESPERMPAQSPERKQAQSLERMHSSDLKMNSSVNSRDSFSLYTAIPLQSASNSWNDLNSIVFGSFHQNDARFPEQSRGYQCTCNASCMLAYSISLDIENSSVLDKVLCEGNTLYQNVISKLKTDGKFIHHLLSLDEIPDDFKLDKGEIYIREITHCMWRPC